jgi:hypothetical protein
MARVRAATPPLPPRQRPDPATVTAPLAARTTAPEAALAGPAAPAASTDPAAPAGRSPTPQATPPAPHAADIPAAPVSTGPVDRLLAPISPSLIPRGSVQASLPEDTGRAYALEFPVRSGPFAAGGRVPAHSPAASARQPSSDLGAFLSHLLPAVGSPFTWPARMPRLAKRWIVDAIADSGKSGLAVALVAALISMIGLATAGAALTRRRLVHTQWRTRLRRSRRGLGWPTVVDPSRTHDGTAAEVFEIAPARDITIADGAVDLAAKPHRHPHAA